MLYDLAIVIYDFIVHLAAPFSRKPRKMMKGHWVVYELLRQQVEKGEQYIWFHAASLGEFEQGRPLIEMIREKYPNYKILLTFFSPSGYEVRKHYRGADIVCYLPFDKPRNVKKFLDIANPCMAFFIKYEFWKNYLDELHKRRIPVYSVSSIFRRESFLSEDALVQTLPVKQHETKYTVPLSPLAAAGVHTLPNALSSSFGAYG